VWGDITWSLGRGRSLKWGTGGVKVRTSYWMADRSEKFVEDDGPGVHQTREKGDQSGGFLGGGGKRWWSRGRG